MLHFAQPSTIYYSLASPKQLHFILLFINMLHITTCFFSPCLIFFIHEEQIKEVLNANNINGNMQQKTKVIFYNKNNLNPSLIKMSMYYGIRVCQVLFNMQMKFVSQTSPNMQPHGIFTFKLQLYMYFYFGIR